MDATHTEALFGEHRNRVFRYLCRTVGHVETARDLTQDVFVRVSSTKVPDGDAGQGRAWLFRIARNLATDHFRRQQRRPEEPLPALERGRTESQHVRLEVRQALGELSAIDRDVFLMRELGGLSYDEIAVACELTPDAVRNRIHRARQQLRAALQGDVQSTAARGVRFRNRR